MVGCPTKNWLMKLSLNTLTYLSLEKKRFRVCLNGSRFFFLYMRVVSYRVYSHGI